MPAPTDRSLQDTYAPRYACFGCGPANPKGLRIQSMLVRDASGDHCVADWTPEAHHEAFPGMLNGGIIGALLDCHCNWTAAWHLMERAGASSPPCTVTAEYKVTLRAPTPSDQPVHLEARVVEARDDRAVIEAVLSSGGTPTATCRGTFVAVREGHPAYHRW